MGSILDTALIITRIPQCRGKKMGKIDGMSAILT